MRALLIVLDSVGVGAAPDAESYGDVGANTLGHILARFPDLRLPNLYSLGLGRILGNHPEIEPRACYGRMRPRSAGKDSTTGHWEIAGIILDQPFSTFTSFPTELVKRLELETKVQFLGNCTGSGTDIINQLGEEHTRTGRPILYTSADSVLQIAAHEDIVPLARLYEICKIARQIADDYYIGRVIARPFNGVPGAFVRTAGRHDYSIAPPPSVLTQLIDSKFPVVSIGKTADLFANQGISESFPTANNHEGMRRIDELWSRTTNGLVFANLVDFDTVYGHRRNPEGYARALEDFDDWLGGFLPKLLNDDLIIITADHGNDPTYRGTDHTREDVPIIMKLGDLNVDLGCRSTFADIAATLTSWFQLSSLPNGESILRVTADSDIAPLGPKYAQAS